MLLDLLRPWTPSLRTRSLRTLSLRTLSATAAISLALALGLPAAAHADLAPPKLLKPRPAKPAKPEAAKLETLRGEIKRHPKAGTKEEMLTGRYHLYAGAKVYEVQATKQVSEERMDEVAGRSVEVQAVRREIAEDRNTDVPVQRPSGGLPAKVVYELIAIKVL
jgi:hypothetical protein